MANSSSRQDKPNIWPGLILHYTMVLCFPFPLPLCRGEEKLAPWHPICQGGLWVAMFLLLFVGNWDRAGLAGFAQVGKLVLSALVQPKSWRLVKSSQAAHILFKDPSIQASVWNSLGPFGVVGSKQNCPHSAGIVGTALAGWQGYGGSL